LVARIPRTPQGYRQKIVPLVLRELPRLQGIARVAALKPIASDLRRQSLSYQLGRILNSYYSDSCTRSVTLDSN
jgi:hypothetical protein